MLGRWPRAGLIKPGRSARAAAGWNKAAFEAKTLDETVKALGGNARRGEQGHRDHLARHRRERRGRAGAVTSKIPKTQGIYMLVEKNPNALAAGFTSRPAPSPASPRAIKMGQTSNVNAVVKADSKFYVASKEVKVTLGGCGG